MQTMAQLFIGAAILLIWYIMSKDRGEKEPHSALWAAAGFGLLGLVIAGIIEALFLPADFDITKKLSGNELLNVSLAIGVIEEICKFLPLALFIYKKSYFNEYNDGVLYFAIAGLGFGVPENILYTLDGGVGTGIVRLIMTPFFHAATTAFIGYFLVRMKLRHGSVTGVLGALGLMILVHAAYDYGLLSGKLPLIGMAFVLTLGLNVLLAVLVARAHKQDEQIACGQPSSVVNQQQAVSQLPGATTQDASLLQQSLSTQPVLEPPQGTGLATAALILGIVALLFAIIPVAGLLFGAPALIMGALAYRCQHGMALGAIITGSIGALAGLAWAILFVVVAAS